MVVEELATHALKLRKTVVGLAVGETWIEKRQREIVTGGGERGAGDAVATDVGVSRYEEALVALGLAEIDTRAERERHGAVEVAPGVRVERALVVVSAARVAAGSGEDVIFQRVGIDGRTGGIGHRNGVRPEIKNVRKRNGDARPARRRGVKEAGLHVAIPVGGARVGKAGIEFPDRTVVAPDDRWHDGPVLAAVAHGDELQRALAGGAAGEIEREITGVYASDIEGEFVVVDADIERRIRERERDAVFVGELVVGGDAEGGAVGVLAAVADDGRPEVGLVEGRVGKRGAVGRILHAAPEILDLRFAGVLAVHTGGESEAEAFVHRREVGEIETGVNLPRGTPGRGGLTPMLDVIAHQKISAEISRGARAFERAARDEIHGPGEGVALRVGRRREGHLDAGEVVDRHLIEADAPRGAAAAAADRTGEAEAVERDGDVNGRHAVQRNIAGVAPGVVDVHAGHKFHELGDVALGDVAKLIGGDDVLHVGGEPLFIDREGGGAHLARGGDDEIVEFHDRAVGGGRASFSRA